MIVDIRIDFMHSWKRHATFVTISLKIMNTMNVATVAEICETVTEDWLLG